MRLPLPCCCFIPAWLTLHGMACQAVLLHEHGLNARVLASGAQCSSGVCWYLMWGESGCAVPCRAWVSVGNSRSGRSGPPEHPCPRGLGAGRQIAACGQWDAGAPREHGRAASLCAACCCAACTALAGPLHRWGWASSQVRLLAVPGEERGFCLPGGWV